MKRYGIQKVNEWWEKIERKLEIMKKARNEIMQVKRVNGADC